MRFVVKSHCVCCAACSVDCPTGAIHREGNQFVINQEMCIGCGDCYTICPVGAISLISEEVEIDQSNP